MDLLRRSNGMTESVWELTGTRRCRPTWLGFALVWVEERRDVYRPVLSGYSPANWITETRWRRARMRDL